MTDSYITKEDLDYLINLFEFINGLANVPASNNSSEFTRFIINGISDKLLFFKDYDPELEYEEGSIVTFNKASVVECIAEEERWEEVITMFKLLRRESRSTSAMRSSLTEEPKSLSKRVLKNITHMISIIHTESLIIEHRIIEVLIDEVEFYIRDQFDIIPDDVDDLLCELAGIRIGCHVDRQEGYVSREFIDILSELFS